MNHAKWCSVSKGGRRCDCDADMKLPAGRTCSDCAFFQKCKAFIGIAGTETICDWAPSRFVLGPSLAAR